MTVRSNAAHLACVTGVLLGDDIRWAPGEVYRPDAVTVVELGLWHLRGDMPVFEGPGFWIEGYDRIQSPDGCEIFSCTIPAGFDSRHGHGDRQNPAFVRARLTYLADRVGMVAPDSVSDSQALRAWIADVFENLAAREILARASR